MKTQDQEEAIRQAERAEREAKLDLRRQNYYNEPDNRYVRRTSNIFIFKPEDLDNDAIIDAVESTPTRKRSQQLLKDIIHQSTGYQPSADNTQTSDQQQPTRGIISFV